MRQDYQTILCIEKRVKSKEDRQMRMEFQIKEDICKACAGYDIVPSGSLFPAKCFVFQYALGLGKLSICEKHLKEILKTLKSKNLKSGESNANGIYVL